MHKIPFEHLPEIHERRIFPFNPSRVPSPARSGRVSQANSVVQSAINTPKGNPRQNRPYLLTAHGIEMVAEPGPTLRGRSHLPRDQRNKRPDGLDKTYTHHVYRSNHEFGHWNVSNNVNSFLAYEAIPNWSTSSRDYGIHYQHPLQTYSHGVRNRMPDFQTSI